MKRFFLVLNFLLIHPAWSQNLLKVSESDPPKTILRRTKYLTHSFTSSAGNDFGDPSVPDFSEDGVVQVYTTGGQVLKWSASKSETAVMRFLRGVSPTREYLHLSDPNPNQDFDPWDPTIETFPEFGADKFLYAGVMTAPIDRDHARWPEDNWRRRVNAFTWDKKRNAWMRVADSILGDAPDHFTWIDHSYGHQFIRDGKNQVWMFYEKVTEELEGQPSKTEIFARRLKNPITLESKEYPILTIPTSPWPSAHHAKGYLVEGARPVALKNGYLMAFSAGEYHSNHYGIHFAWSKNITGPYAPFLTSSKKDLKDFGMNLRKKLSLIWGPGRPALFQVDGQWWMLFHGINKNDPNQVDHDLRGIYLTPIEISEKQNERPDIYVP